jgi:hypothetical protein
MKLLINSYLFFLFFPAASLELQDKQFLAAALDAPLTKFAEAVSRAKNLACQDSMNNNFLHRLAMRKDEPEVFYAGVRLAASKNYHQLLVQKNLGGLLPIDMAIKNWPANKDQIESAFFSAILHPDDLKFDQPDKYFWSRLIAVSAMFKANQKKGLRAKPY